ncbi:hypothetical protein GLOIN_2v1648644 [Rhizophagus clarus]|uniref:Uncharacterized protein n=1 Tax=Rhizophagus clarus TaxID=94130 RepID=A0A8H3QX72_9GLOM|nr:hypothetical protein GLOIN_2v1648644 [Rhizophagus clarus]
MSSKIYEQKIPYIQKTRLNNNSIRIRRRPQKSCPDCKETKECVDFFSNKINRLEELANNFHKNLYKTNTKQISVFHSKFTLNGIPCELEYDLSHFTLENLQKLANFTTQNCNNKSNSSGKNDN